MLVGEFSGGADGHGHEGNDKARKAARPGAPEEGQTARLTSVQKRAYRGNGEREFFVYHSFETYQCGLPVA